MKLSALFGDLIRLDLVVGGPSPRLATPVPLACQELYKLAAGSGDSVEMCKDVQAIAVKTNDRVEKDPSADAVRGGKDVQP